MLKTMFYSVAIKLAKVRLLPVVVEDHEPVVDSVEADLVPHVPDGESWKRVHALHVPDGDDEGVEALARAVGGDQLGE